MIHNLGAGRDLPLDCSMPSLSLSAQRAQRRELLKQRINQMRQRTDESFVKVETVQNGQEKLHQMAENIQKNQAEIEHKQIVMEEKQKRIAKNTLVIKKSQHCIHLTMSRITFKWKELYQEALGIQKDQKVLKLKLENVLHKREAIQQRTSLIKQNVALICANIDEVAQMDHQIQQKAVDIQQNQELIKQEVKDIVQKRDHAYQQIYLLNPQQIKGYDYRFPILSNPNVLLPLKPNDFLPLKPNGLGDKKVEDLGAKTSLGFWSWLLQKIRNFTFEIMANVGQDLANSRLYIKNRLTDYQWSLMISFVTHPATRVMLGVLTFMASKNLKFGFLYIAVEGFFHVQRSHNFSIFNPAN